MKLQYDTQFRLLEAHNMTESDIDRSWANAKLEQPVSSNVQYHRRLAREGERALSGPSLSVGGLQGLSRMMPEFLDFLCIGMVVLL